MQVSEQLSDLIATTNDAAEILGKCLADSIRLKNRGEIETITRVAGEVLSLREFLESNSSRTMRFNLELGRPVSESDAIVTQHRSGEAAALSQKSEFYTRGGEFAPYVLLAFLLLGGKARFRDAQAVMYASMKADNVLRDIDELSTAGTTRPRYLSNSTSHKGTMIRRGFLAEGENGLDELSAIGIQTVEKWLEENGKERSQYNTVVPNDLFDRYFHLDPFAATLYLMGGQAAPAEVDRAYVKLQKTFPQLLGRGQEGGLSASHLDSFKHDGILKITSKGQVLLTDFGQQRANNWLKTCPMTERDLRLRLARRKRNPKTEGR
jgi:hypothetical protein